MKIKNKIIITTFLMFLPVSGNAVVTEAGLVPILKDIYKSGVEMTKTLGGIQGSISAGLNLDGITADGAILTDKIAKRTTEWVPAPFQDNAQNAVQACLQDFRKKFFAAIKWPSVEICGYDIIGDLKQDIANYLNNLAANMEKKYGKLKSKKNEDETTQEKKENQQQKKKQLEDIARNHDKPALAGREKGIEMINNPSSFVFGIKRDDQTFDNLTLGRTLENIRNISNDMRVLGLKYNSDLLIPANLYKNQSVLQSDIMKNNMTYNQKQINSFENVLKYKEVENILKNNNISDPNLVIANKVDKQMLKNYLVVREKKITVSVPGTNGEMSKQIIEHEFQPLTDVYKNGKIDTDVMEEFGGDSNSNNFNYVVQASKIFDDTMETTAQFVDSSDADSKHRTLVTLLEGLNKLMVIQIAQDYQFGKVLLNVQNNNDNVQSAQLKTINDKLRLLQLSLSNLNIDINKHK